MKIFLNDRIIEFIPSCPEKALSTDMVVEYDSPENLKSALDEFERYEKFRQLLIADPEILQHGDSKVFRAFVSLFKLVPAAGGLVKNEKGEFLFIHRLGFWDLPKGKIDKRDVSGSANSDKETLTARAAAIREVKEETGLVSVDIVRELRSTWHIYTLKEKRILKETRWFDMAADSGQKLTPETREGIFLAKWTPPSAIQCILSNTYASIRELLSEVLS